MARKPLTVTINLATADADWKEEDHKRDKDGQFAKTAGAKGGGQEKPAAPAKPAEAPKPAAAAPKPAAPSGFRSTPKEAHDFQVSGSGFSGPRTVKGQHHDIHVGEEHLGSIKNYAATEVKRAPGAPRAYSTGRMLERWSASPSQKEGQPYARTEHNFRSRKEALSWLLRQKGYPEDMPPEAQPKTGAQKAPPTAAPKPAAAPSAAAPEKPVAGQPKVTNKGNTTVKAHDLKAGDKVIDPRTNKWVPVTKIGAHINNAGDMYTKVETPNGTFYHRASESVPIQRASAPAAQPKAAPAAASKAEAPKPAAAPAAPQPARTTAPVGTQAKASPIQQVKQQAHAPSVHAKLRPDPGGYKHPNDQKWMANRLKEVDAALSSPKPAEALAAIRTNPSYSRFTAYLNALKEHYGKG